MFSLFKKKPCPPSPFEIAQKEIGQKEEAGKKHNKRIVEYHATTTLKADADEVPWCSAFVNWCVIQAGLKGTNSALAKSWLKWGRKLDEPKKGCVVVLWRRSPKAMTGHVGFFVAKDHEKVFLLGGNQNNAVCIKGYPLSRVIEYREAL